MTKTQIKILEVLIEARGPITRNRISERCGYQSSVAVYQQVGWPDIEKRKEYETEMGYKTLLSLGYVTEIPGIEVDGVIETGIRITHWGRKALVRETEKTKSLKQGAIPLFFPKPS